MFQGLFNGLKEFQAMTRKEIAYTVYNIHVHFISDAHAIIIVFHESYSLNKRSQKGIVDAKMFLNGLPLLAIYSIPQSSLYDVNDSLRYIVVGF